ncbi:hypothetical protein DRE_07576 [Drechslerella stenobrocha 248]|uniref:Polarized growth protein Boi2 n=1 Tax=Drechslerella stenobrocha 248 TaxID=1043628 RepID=W7HI08_9PEZI|nr:hypothetical protein DRE_07576 [Drechslerella stenobrocha 248]
MAEPASAIDYLQVLHDFEARSPDELSLGKNAKIELLERDEEYNDGWYLGRDPESGKIGLFPQVYTTKWRADSTLRASAIAPTEGDVVSPPAYSNEPLEPKQEIPKRLSVTPELLLEESNFGGPAPKEVSAETPPLLVENTNEKRRISDDFKQLHRSPVVVDTLSDIEEALSEIRTAPRSVGSHPQKSKQQPPPIMETPEPHRLAEQGFDDDSASDYSSGAGEDVVSIPLASTNLPLGNRYDNTYATRSADSIHEHGGHPLQYSQVMSGQSSSEEDEDEDIAVEGLYSWDEVQTWTPAQVSAYFQEQQLPLNICDKFEEQEISGAILLQLEMSHLKELELGSFGKRFEVWKEIEKLQMMVRNKVVGRVEQSAEKTRNRSSSTPSGVLPRLPSLHNRPPVRGGSFAIPQSQPDTLFDHMGMIRETRMSMGPLSPTPPPKSDISGVTSDRRSVSTASMERASSSGGGQPLKNHGRDPSFDRNWTLKGHRANESTASNRSRFTGDSGIASQSSSVLYANDRSISGDDGGKRERNVLHKRVGSAGSHGHQSHHSSPSQTNSPGHGKMSSYSDEQRNRSGNHTPTSPSPSLLPPRVVSKQTFTVLERSYETALAQQPADNDVQAQAHSPIAHANLAPGYSSPSPASVVYHNSVKGRKRSTSDAHVLSMDSRARDSLAASVMPGGKAMAVELPPPEEARHVPPNIHIKANYQRSASDGAEKAMAMSPMSQDTSSTLLSPNGSEHSNSLKITIDAPERRSDEANKRNGNFKEKKLRSVASASGIRQKSKKQMTSAYQEGLKEVSPVKAAAEADFSGWMKKRGSSAVVATWKSRFFVLKGRRLSYFYSMEDTKERGLIDITSHRVLPAADDRIVALHASVAAITTSTPASQASSANPGHSSGPAQPPNPPQKGGWFTFKLVPPAPGAAKGVTFTPPKLHYFATDSKYVGRQWMAAFMKATIDRDETAPVISTFSANTISLAKARAMRARPPGFGENTVEQPKTLLFGLPIMGSQGSFNDSIESALAERQLIDDELANAADDER